MNLRSAIATKQLASGETYMDLGSGTPGSSDPALNSLDPPGIPEGYLNFLDSLMNLLRVAMFTPDAGYGELAGTQRSSDTLYGLVWPMESHVTAERILWSTGLSMGAEIALRMLAAKEQAGINRSHLGLWMRADWSPIFPKSRVALTQQLVQREAAGHVSDETALAMYGDIPESQIEDEIARIREKQRAEAGLSARAKDPVAGQPIRPGT